MNKFIRYISILGASVLLAMFVLDFTITKHLQQSDQRMFKSWNEIIFDTTNYDMLIVGSSRAWQHYDTEIIDRALNISCYNQGLDGKGLDAFVSRYHIYRKSHKVPQYVILNLDLNLYSSNGYEREQYLPYFKCINVFDEVQKQEDFKTLERYIPLVRYAGYTEVIKEGLGLPNKLTKIKLHKGFGNENNTWNGTAFNQQKIVHMGRDLNMVSLLNEFLRELKSEGVFVYLVASPTYCEVFDKIPKEEQTAYWEFYEKIAEQYNCQLIDFLNSDISSDTTNFANAMHLSKKGAEIFTTRLCETIIEQHLYP